MCWKQEGEFCAVNDNFFVSGDKTDGYIGASELLLGTTICGILFSIFSGQPLLIVGFTGPLLVFEEGVYSVSILILTELLFMSL